MKMEENRRDQGGPGRNAPVSTPHRDGRPKTLLLVFLGAHFPLFALVAYLLFLFPGGVVEALPIVVAAFLGTWVGSAIALRAIAVLPAPVPYGSSSLRADRQHSHPAKLPSEVDEEGARIIRNMKENIIHLKKVIESLEENAAKDPLTGAYNRKGGEERLTEDLARVSRGGESITLAVLDLDQLKEVNDRWGHQAGDVCLSQLINALESHIREGDWIARWGGDEFVVGFWNAKEPSAAEATLQRLAEYLERNPVSLPRGQRVWVSFSAGVCTHRDGESAAELFSRTDMALIEAKRKGRNRVITKA
jgi:diguanylate cyclase (GGDEF)-like protein